MKQPGTIAVQLTPATWRKLSRLARQSGLTSETIIRQAVVRELADMEKDGRIPDAPAARLRDKKKPIRK
jgi:predicted transcriptional regulator